MVSKISGFTLIELLVAMSLLSLIVLTGTSAFGIFSQRWDGRLGTFDEKMESTQSILMVQDVLSSLVPYAAMNQEGKPIKIPETLFKDFKPYFCDSIKL